GVTPRLCSPSCTSQPSVYLAVLPPSPVRCSDALLHGASRKQRSSYSGVMKLLRCPPFWRLPFKRGFLLGPIRL
ncbi:hypothetical protein GOODEAATRI_001799, partial [Goodea atripinnis]